MLVALKPPQVRKLTIQQVIARLRDRMAKIDGIRVFFVPLQDLNLGAQSGGGRYQYTLWGVDEDEVTRTAEAMIRRVRALPEVTDIIRQLGDRRPAGRAHHRPAARGGVRCHAGCRRQHAL